MENHGSFQQKNSIDFFVSSYNFLIRQYNPVYKGLAVFLFSQIHRATEPYPYIFALSRCIFRCKPCNKTSHFHICSCFRSMQIFWVHLLLRKSCLRITVSITFFFQCFNKFHVVHVHSSNQKRHMLAGTYLVSCMFCFLYAVFSLSGRNDRVRSAVSSYNLINCCISAFLYLFCLLHFVIVPPC